MNFPGLIPGTGCLFLFCLKAKNVAQNNTRNLLFVYIGEQAWYLVGKIAALKVCGFCYLRKLCFKITRALKIQLDFACNNWTYSLKCNNCILYFWCFGKTQKCLEPSCQHREDFLVAPLENFCPCFCTILSPQQTANLAWIKAGSAAVLVLHGWQQWRVVHTSLFRFPCAE